VFKLLSELIDLKTSIQDTQCLKPVPISEGKYKNVRNDKDDNTLVIDNSGVVDRIQQHEPEGDRIINISFFHEELHRTFDNYARGIEYQFKDWKRLVNTRRCGFKTISSINAKCVIIRQIFGHIPQMVKL